MEEIPQFTFPRPEWRSLFRENAQQSYGTLQQLLNLPGEECLRELAVVIGGLEEIALQCGAESYRNGEMLLYLLAMEMRATKLWPMVRERLLVGHSGVGAEDGKTWLWEVIYRLGNGVDSFVEIARDSTVPLVVRTAALLALGHWGWHRPVERGKVLQSLRSMIEQEIGWQEAEEVMENRGEFCRGLITTTVNLRASNLVPVLEQLIKLNPRLRAEFPMEKLRVEIAHPINRLQQQRFSDLRTWFNRLFPIMQATADPQILKIDKPLTPNHFRRKQEPYQRLRPKTGRNEPCPCGSGKKYKKCCLKRS